ncbi:MAG: hypothetical protein AAF850_02980 [Pseudomonadota bacterium]
MNDERKIHNRNTLRSALNHCATELASLNKGMLNIQDALTDHFSANETKSDGERLQAIDAVTQSLEAVSEFLRELSDQCAPDWAANVDEAAASIKLRDVADRLAGREATPSPNSGDFELF